MFVGLWLPTGHIPHLPALYQQMQNVTMMAWEDYSVDGGIDEATEFRVGNDSDDDSFYGVCTT